MGGKTRPPYPAEYRARIMELARAGRSPEELAKEFEPTGQTIPIGCDRMTAMVDVGRTV